jgi:hypothetical protein
MAPEKDPVESNDKLLAYFMGQTNTRLVSIEEKLVELIAFRAEVVASAKSTSTNISLVISVVVGILMLLVNVVLKKLGLL